MSAKYKRTMTISVGGMSIRLVTLNALILRGRST